MKILNRGAEAILYKENNVVVKERIVKKYRHPEIDCMKRKYATRREASLIEKAQAVIPVAKLLKKDEIAMKIEIEYLDGILIRDCLEQNTESLCKEMGENVAKLHDADIIHGDLTTSNMILSKNKIHFIDFGLGFISPKVEDKAVDLHVLKQALEAKHYKVAEKAFISVLEGYQKSKNFSEVIKRLEKVEKRGRYKY